MVFEERVTGAVAISSLVTLLSIIDARIWPDTHRGLHCSIGNTLLWE